MKTETHGIFKRYICMKYRFMNIIAMLLAAACLFSASSCGTKSGYSDGTVTFINVSYDPTREFYEDYNEIFAEHWKELTGQDVNVVQSHGGSAKQALEVANGLEASVVTLALAPDIDSIQAEGLIDEGWIDEYPLESSPYTSTIVFLVKKGNPKNIHDWDDLIRDDVQIITPNPKTSGGARWNYMAAWAYADKLYDGDETQIEAFVKKLYQNVLVLDSGARNATTTFVENGQGDVLIAWENEAYLSMQDAPDEYEIVNPSISILAQPSVAVVDEVVDKRGTREVATEYLDYLYSDDAQRIAAEHYYRPSNEDILQEYSDVFDLDIELVTIDDFGGWDEVQKKHFSDGGVFDRIYSE
jgi:sulfate transport system substrate-binding protein